MTDMEILAELKRGYEYLIGICQNAVNNSHDSDYQIAQTEEMSLMVASGALEDVYARVWKRIFDKDREKLEIPTKRYSGYKNCVVYVSDYIAGDYYTVSTDDTEYTTDLGCGDLGYKWYEDNDFICYNSGRKENDIE